MRPFVLMALGAFRFAVRNGGFHETQRESSWRWAEQEVIGMAPRLQFVGPGSDSMTLQGTLLPQYRGGLGQIDAIRAQAGLGVPLIMIDGTGYFYGLVVIERVAEIRSVFMPDGAPRKIDFTISVKRYA